MKLTLSMPPSINKTYGVSRTGDWALFKKKDAKNWEEEAGWQLKKQLSGKKKTFPGNVQVGITWFYYINRDIDAGIKILFDLLERQQVVTNDRQIRKIMYVDIFQDSRNPRVEVEIQEME